MYSTSEDATDSYKEGTSISDDDYSDHDAKNNEYTSDLANENSQKYESFSNPLEINGPKENYMTVQHGTRRYDTVITQSFRPNGEPAEEQNTEQKSDPALGSEYVSFPQDALKDDSVERYWDYVPIDNRIMGVDGDSKVAKGIQRTVDKLQAQTAQLSDSPKDFNSTKPNAHLAGLKSLAKKINRYLDRKIAYQSDSNEYEESSKVKSDKPHSEKTNYLSNVLQKLEPLKSKEEETAVAKKRQGNYVNVRTRSPEPDGKFSGTKFVKENLVMN